jgi:hypothetical protein
LTEAETGSLVAALVDQAAMPVVVREAVLERAQGIRSTRKSLLAW